jgi:maleamate amidohydrolase
MPSDTAPRRAAPVDEGAAVRRPWDGIVAAEDVAAYRKAGFGHESGLGKRPALLVIDVQYRSIGEAPRPLLEAIEEYPTSCGERGWQAVERIAALLAAFREMRLPVLYPYVAPKEAHDGGRFAEKVPGIMSIPPRGYEFVAAVAPAPADIRVPKYHASAFFGTPLVSHLMHLGVDSIVVTGCTTSGCVRATVVDGVSYGFRAMVPEDAVFDRGTVSHAVNLFDIASKYADVLPVTEVIRQLRARAAR